MIFSIYSIKSNHTFYFIPVLKVGNFRSSNNLITASGKTRIVSLSSNILSAYIKPGHIWVIFLDITHSLYLFINHNQRFPQTEVYKLVVYIELTRFRDCEDRFYWQSTDQVAQVRIFSSKLVYFIIQIYFFRVMNLYLRKIQFVIQWERRCVFALVRIVTEHSVRHCEDSS